MTATPAVPAVTLTIQFTPRGPAPAATPQAVRDWVTDQVTVLTPVLVEHTGDDGGPTTTAYDITSVDLTDED
jgi:hypothetical protein